LIGANSITLPVGASFTDPGANVTDNVDASRTITGLGSVNTDQPGTYTLTYTAVDAAGNLATSVTRTVFVVGSSVDFVTSNRSPLEISNFFRSGAFANATSVIVSGRLPSGMRYTPATRLISGYPTSTSNSVARFTVTLPGAAPFIYTMNFRVEPVPAGFLGVHTLHTDEGDTVTITITSAAAATVSILSPPVPPATVAPRAVSARGIARFNSSETDPNRKWTIDIPAQQLAVALPTNRSLKQNDGSFLGNYGTIAGKALWGFKRSNTTGTIGLKKGNVELNVVGTYVANGSVTWRVTPTVGRVVTTPAGSISTDGILSIRTIIPNAGLLTGMLRVEEQLNDQGVPTGELSVSLLQGFDGWELTSFTPQ
jgi:hypothetical protein